MGDKGRANTLIRARDIVTVWVSTGEVPSLALEYILDNHEEIWCRLPFFRNLVARGDEALPPPVLGPDEYGICEALNIPLDDLVSEIGDSDDYLNPEIEPEFGQSVADFLEAGLIEFLTSTNRKRVRLSFIRILQYWTVDCRISHQATTKLLRMLKRHKPVIEYKFLPSTAQTLLKLSPKDKCAVVSYDIMDPTDAGKKLGSYHHYGVEAAVFGTSPGL
jgi:hypothetical protein